MSHGGRGGRVEQLGRHVGRRANDPGRVGQLSGRQAEVGELAARARGDSGRAIVTSSGDGV
jgi:hypothetical protein